MTYTFRTSDLPKLDLDTDRGTDFQATQHKIQQSYNRHAHDLSALQVGNHVAIQNPITKMWNIYGVITAIGLFRRYFVKTKGGCVLVRNRRFLRKRSPLSIAAPTGVHYSHIPTPATSDTATEQRRSTRVKTAPSRLSNDPKWLFSSSNFQ